MLYHEHGTNTHSCSCCKCLSIEPSKIQLVGCKLLEFLQAVFYRESMTAFAAISHSLKFESIFPYLFRLRLTAVSASLP